MYPSCTIPMDYHNHGYYYNDYYGYHSYENGPNVVWETHHVTLHKAPTFGFGIAVSGGHGSPHFANGDPSVAISDVLKAGPAEGKLQINDRILSVNGFSLENVDHTTAINVLRDCGNSVKMVVKRRVILPGSSSERNSLPSKIVLTKKNKKDDYGVILGCQFFVKEVVPHSLASHDRSLKEGDTILKINNTPVEGLSLAEARRMLDKSKDKLILLVSPPPPPPSSTAAAAAVVQQPQQDEMRAQVWLNNSSPPGDYRRPPPDDVNVYRPSVRSEEDLYVKDPRSMSQQQQPLPPPPPPLPQTQGDPNPSSRHQPVPPGAYPDSQNTRYDGHYVLDNDLPPRNLLPGRDLDPRDGYHSDWDDPSRGRRRDRDYEDDVFPSPPRIHDLEPRKVTFTKDKQTGLGLRLAGGNATGIYIASVQAGSEAEREGLVEGDNILVANEKEITGLTREEAVSYLTSLNGLVTMVVQYKKEDYDCIMASHEAGDSFYIRVHFNHQVEDSPTEHSFQAGDTFLVKDTLFRGVGGSWLAIRVSDDLQQAKKGTMPNGAAAEKLKAQQKGDNNNTKDAFPNRGKGSLFRKKSARRSKSLGKDHWEEVVFDDEDSATLETKFPAYERVVMQDPGFVRPVVIFGAIADIARDRLLAEYPDKFESPQIESDGDKKGKTAIIRLGAIRDAINKGKHCLLDVTPSTVDRLQYGQYCPLVIFLQPQSRQAVKDVRTRWKGAGGAKNARKLQEHGEKLERNYAHMFTGVIHHMGTDAWFPKLSDIIETQQTQPCWMSCKLPQEDMNEEFMFPMSPRFSYAAGADSDVELPRPRDDFDLQPSSATLKPRLVRSSSDPSVNTMENIPGIPPYPSPPTYKNQRIPSHDSRLSVQDVSPRPYRDDELMHPEDRYYPSYYTDHQADPRSYAASRAHIDPYATLTPSEKLRPRIEPDRFHGEYRDYYGDRGGNYPPYPPGVSSPNQPWNRDYPVPPDNLSQSSDSYTKYVSSPQNKHDDTKLREKFAHLNSTGSDRGKSHDPYRFTRSTAHPVSSATVDRAKLSDLTAKYRRHDNQLKPKGPPPPVAETPPQLPIKKKEPPPVPVKTYSLKQRGPVPAEPDERKMRNYENSNRAYNYTDVNTATAGGGTGTPPLPPPPSAASLLGHHHPQNHHHYPSQFNSTPALDDDQTYEYMSVRNAQLQNNSSSSSNNLNKSNFLPPSSSAAAATTSSSSLLQQRVFDANNISTSSHSTNNLNSPPPASNSSPHHPILHHRHNNNIPTSSSTLPPSSSLSSSSIHNGMSNNNNNFPADNNGKAFANEVYMDTWDLGRAKSSVDVRGGAGDGGGGGRGGLTEGGRSEEYLAGMGYRRPRTDDEQIRDLQISRERARSESRFVEYSPHQQKQPYGVSVSNRGIVGPYPVTTPNNDDMGATAGRSRLGRDRTRYKSLDDGVRGVMVNDEVSSPGHKDDGGKSSGGGRGGGMFDAYTKLVTPGLFSMGKNKSAGRGGLSKFQSRSQNALDDRR